MYKGIDISHHQGNIDFNKAIKGQDFVIIKATQGKTYKDTKFDEYYNALNGRVPVGCYVYNKVTSVEDAKKEAQFFVNTIKGKSFPAGCWLDMEDPSMASFSKDLKDQIIRAEAEIIRNAGFSVGIYCSYDWYKNKLNSSKLCDNFVFWIARYTSVESRSPLKNQKNCCIWQYSSKGAVDGISGNVDMNKADQNPVDVMRLFGGAMEQQTSVGCYPKYTGSSASIVSVLLAIGESDTSYAHRKKIASSNEIEGYSGTAGQNLYMVKLAKAGLLKRA